MSLTLTLREAPAAPVLAEVLRPDRLAGRSAAAIERLELRHGNRVAAVRELFHVEGGGANDVRIEGDLARVAGLGAGMAAGRLTIAGRAGAHLGAGITGGEIVVEGDAGDWAGAEMRGGRVVLRRSAGRRPGRAHPRPPAGMRGGRIVLRGSAGRRLGGACAGSRAGMHGGEILVHGDAGDEAGAGLRRGVVAVAGRTGAAAGLAALAGTIVALGPLGAHPGALMRRASIVAMTPPQLLPTYAEATTYRPTFLRLLLRRLRDLGLPVGDEQIEGRYTRWSGVALEINRGEILILEAA